jgi:pimeloyl-ACP methyl ester carboxylesterase
VALAKLELELQEELAHLSPNSQLILAKDSGHFIMWDQPDLVIDTINNMVKAVR